MKVPEPKHEKFDSYDLLSGAKRCQSEIELGYFALEYGDLDETEQEEVLDYMEEDYEKFFRSIDGVVMFSKVDAHTMEEIQELDKSLEDLAIDMTIIELTFEGKFHEELKQRIDY